MAALRRTILLWTILFPVMVSCAPGFITPTPVATLDPNAISLLIAQTAEAASLQTMAAMPPSTPTPVSTLTPRSTFTPEPTFTPVQTFIIPSPTPLLRLQYYRLKHDDQLALYNYKSRTFDDNSDGMRDQTPEIVPFFLQPKTTSGSGRTTVDGAWETFIYALNDNNESRVAYLKGTRSALFNTAGFPQMESLSMGGNIITLDEVQGEWGRVNTLEYGGPPNAEKVNYRTRPDLIHKFVVVGWKRSTKSTIIVNPPKGDIYYPLVSRRPIWVQMERLERFPALPMDVTLKNDVYIQPEPGAGLEPTRFQLSAGDTVRVIDYYPSGSNVWGRLQRGGWIPLLLYPQYQTSWEMETIPPPP